MSVTDHPMLHVQHEGIAAHKAVPRAHGNDSVEHVLHRSIEFPSILIGWRVQVPSFGSGVVLSVHKKKFRPTHFRILFDNGSTEKLPLQRSLKKGTVPFTLLKRVN